MAFINMRMEYDLFTTPLPNTFIDDYLPFANPAYVTVYIFSYRHCFHGNSSMNTNNIAEKLNLLDSDVINAWRYWEKEKLIKIHTTNQNSFDIEFLQIPPKQTESNKAPELPAVAPILLEKKPEYSVEELDVYMDTSTEVRNLFAFSQRCLAKPLNYNDMKTIYGFYDWLCLPFDVIYFLMEYCTMELDKRSLRYIETVALDWSDNSITTVEQAKDYTSQFNNVFIKILKALGQRNSDPSKSQLKYMKTWVNEYKFELDVIEFACDKTLLTIGKPNFPYVNKILKEWFEKNITTLEAAKKDEELFREEQKKNAQKVAEKAAEIAAEKKGFSRPVKNRFINFEQAEWDFDKIKQLEEEYIENRLKK